MEKIELFKALSNKTRLQILTWLKNPEAHFADYELTSKHIMNGICVGHIQKKAGLTQSTISEYLAILQRAGLVTATRVGQWTYYKRNESTFEALGNLITNEL
ncbi:ArsR family transcriptional regulator [Pedobacter changchengzhani]|uniref:ArsR family transcriptional regulator n=1 Tax=Pedobacter changchengzhani TaxID=2529274 RepID=A0A4R5MKG4_9SPHI|nr:metalloregulator ArsR/SmtB family transcription factor [Pedobacter changchengzhani]TDG36150.1 ArsR family transcriptional regulator [Pedobacter changchengzhani]